MFIRVLTPMSGERIINTDKIISICNSGNTTNITIESIGDMMIVSPSYEELATKLIEEQKEDKE